jgi:hypothetical protein
MPEGTLLTDEEYRRFAEKYVALLIEFGFVLEKDRQAEIKYMLKTFCFNKPYARIN